MVRVDSRGLVFAARAILMLLATVSEASIHTRNNVAVYWGTWNRARE